MRNMRWQQATLDAPETPAANAGYELIGKLADGITANGFDLYIIGTLGATGRNACAVEFCGESARRSESERGLTLCHMAVFGIAAFTAIVRPGRRRRSIISKVGVSPQKATIGTPHSPIGGFEKLTLREFRFLEHGCSTRADVGSPRSPGARRRTGGSARTEGLMRSDYMGIKPGEAIEVCPSAERLSDSCTNPGSVIYGRPRRDFARVPKLRTE